MTEDHRKLKVYRNVVAPSHVADLCGPPFWLIDIVDVGGELGIKRAYGYHERSAARRIVAKLIDRTSDSEVVERLRGAYKTLADQTEDEARR